VGQVDLSKISRAKRFELMKQMGLIKGNRHNRRIEKFSDNFNEIFNFFLSSYRKGLLMFGGEGVTVIEDLDGISGKMTFRKYEDGQYKTQEIVSRHVNITKSVILAKKSWGLHVKIWSEGIAECDFTLQEILDTFLDVGIKVPDNLLKGLENEIMKKKIANIDKYFNDKQCTT